MSTITKSGHALAVIGRFEHFWVKKGKIYAKITENWKMFVVFISEDDMV